MKVVNVQCMAILILGVGNKISRDKYWFHLKDHTVLQERDLNKSNLDLVINKVWDGKPVSGYVRGKTHMTMKNEAVITRGCYKYSLCFCDIGSKNWDKPEFSSRGHGRRW